MISVAYNPADQISSITDPTGRVISYGYDSSGDLTSYTDAMGHHWSYAYASAGVLSSITDPDGDVSSISYSSPGVVGSVTYGAGSAAAATTSFGYNSVGSASCPDSTTQACTDVVDGNGNTSDYYFDSAGRPTMGVEANDTQTAVGWDSDDNVTSVTDAMPDGGNTTTFAYTSPTSTAPHALVSTTAPDNGAAESYTYANAAFPYLPTSVTDTQGNVTTYTYDANGNVISQTADGDTSTQGIQGTNASCGARPGEVCYTTTPAGNKTTYGYDSQGDLTTVTPPSPLGETTTTYDSLGRPITVRDGNANTTTYTYDADDLVTNTTYTGGTSSSYTYDADGNMLSETDSSGTTTYTYDALGEVRSEAAPGGVDSSVTYDKAGNVISYTDAGGTITYGYDNANNLISLAEPGGSCAPGAASGCTTFTYNNDDQINTELLPNGIGEFFSYDDQARLSQQDVRQVPSGSTILDQSFSYANSKGTDTELIQTAENDLTGATTTYSYDALNRLTGADTPGAADYLYDYDADGNLTLVSANGGVTNGTATYNAADEITGAGASYDADGNETTLPTAPKLTYNSRSQTTRITPPTGSPYSLGYNGSGQDRLTTDGGASFANTLLGSAAITEGTTTAYLTQTPGGSLVSLRIAGTSYYYITNYQGSVVAVTSNTGAELDSYSYDPFGNLTAATSSFSQPFGYLGAYYDSSSGLYHLGARFYNPADASFTQLDPTGTDPGYAYAGDNPINASDPSGTLISGCYLFADCNELPRPFLTGSVVGNPSDFSTPKSSYLKRLGINAEAEKEDVIGEGGSKYDIYRESGTGDLFVGPKSLRTGTDLQPLGIRIVDGQAYYVFPGQPLPTEGPPPDVIEPSPSEFEPIEIDLF